MGMARENWTYPPMQKELFQQVQRAVKNLNANLPSWRQYESARDYITAAVVEKLEKDGQLEQEVKA